MEKERIKEAISEAKYFISKAELAIKKINEDSLVLISGSKETAACKRASLDLTRTLAKMRSTKR